MRQFCSRYAYGLPIKDVDVKISGQTEDIRNCTNGTTSVTELYTRLKAEERVHAEKQC